MNSLDVGDPSKYSDLKQLTKKTEPEEVFFSCFTFKDPSSRVRAFPMVSLKLFHGHEVPHG